MRISERLPLEGSGARAVGLRQRSDGHDDRPDGGPESARTDAGAGTDRSLLAAEARATRGHSAGQVGYLVRDGVRSDLRTGGTLASTLP